MKKGNIKDDSIPRTITFNFRGDIRDVATLVHIYEDLLGTPIRTKATLLRLAIRDFRALLEKSMDKVQSFKSTEEAYRFLRQRRLMEEDEKLLRMSRIKKMVAEGDVDTSRMVIPASIEELAKEAMSSEEIQKRARELKGEDDGSEE